MPSAAWPRLPRRAFLASTAALSACATLHRGPAVPAADVSEVTVLGLTDIRYWGDEASPQLIAEGFAAYDRELAAWRAAGNGGPLPTADYLAVSGGGEDGAFGAGLLSGWSEDGTRPQFKLVTGISTGALTAPFAFLGPEYDPQLRQVYTQISAKDVLRARSLLAIFNEDALNSNDPLFITLSGIVNQRFLETIGREYGKGRLLLIGTTNLDEGRPVIWNVTKIAASGRPGALDLIRRILVASAAVPGAFPPQMIDVEVNGRPYQEMHVDGGASAQVFVYPPGVNINAESARRGIQRARRLYLIRNGRVDPQWQQVRRNLLPIAGRAISSLLHSNGMNDIFRIYATSIRDGVDFNLAYIPSTFTMELKQPFDTPYMRALFKVGYDLARNGYPWSKAPPGLPGPAARTHPPRSRTKGPPLRYPPPPAAR